jgi:hypothetical protein
LLEQLCFSFTLGGRKLSLRLNSHNLASSFVHLYKLSLVDGS